MSKNQVEQLFKNAFLGTHYAFSIILQNSAPQKNETDLDL